MDLYSCIVKDISRHLSNVVAEKTGIGFLAILVCVSPCTPVFISVQGIICAKQKKKQNKTTELNKTNNNNKRAISVEENRGSVLLPLAKASLVLLAK